MLGVMHYNKFKPAAASTAPSCPVCICPVTAEGGVLADGSVLPLVQWVEQVCKAIKDDTVNGGYQAGCCAGVYPPL